MGREEPKDLTGVVEDVSESGSEGKTKGALEAGVDKLQEMMEPEEEEKDEEAVRARRDQ
jgi:hypothetical protein